MIVPCPIVFPLVFTSKYIKRALHYLTQRKPKRPPILSVPLTLGHEKPPYKNENRVFRWTCQYWWCATVHVTQNTLTQLYLQCGEIYVENKHKPKLNLHQSVRQRRIQNFNRAHFPVFLLYLRQSIRRKECQVTRVHGLPPPLDGGRGHP